MSHDLRSPLSSVQGYIETILMKENKLSDTERKEYLETILKNVINLNRLVHELFELSKLDAMENGPLFEPFSIAELAQDVVLKFQQQAEQKEIHLITKIPVNLPFVSADIGMIDRVLSNFIDNALRFTPSNGKICIELTAADDNVRIKIIDSGSGIPAEEIPYIFDRFYKVEKSRAPNTGGSGLGLAIAKKILDAHGSEVKVESSPGSGTVFTFKLKQYRNVTVKQKQFSKKI
ncbi:MAG: HAMP domain-containing sensor histidine kinase [Calditrichaceae bacterium]